MPRTKTPLRVFDTSEKAHILRRWFLHIERSGGPSVSLFRRFYHKASDLGKTLIFQRAEAFFLTNPTGLDDIN